MTEITHKQAQRYLRAAADGLLRDNQRVILDAHLRDCASCRADADELIALEARLKKNFQARWDAYDGPSRNVLTNIQSRSRRIIMTNRINVGFSMLAGIAALVALGFAINYVIAPLWNASIAADANGTQLTGDAPSAFSSRTDRSIAFVSEKDGNPDIYTMHADGNGWTNLTNDPANDLNPVWSPDGTRIAFESNRSGFKQIFVMMADGTTVIQLTDDKADHELNVNDGGNYSPWSPDGKKLIFSQKVSEVFGEETEILYIMDASGENKKPLVNGADIYYFPSWSPDGKHIAFVTLDYLGVSVKGRIYVTDSNGNNLTDIMKSLPSGESLDHWNYSWSGDAQSISFITHKIAPDTANESDKIDVWSAYEASLDGNTLVMNATSRSPMEDYRQGTYFTTQSSTITWVSVKGKVFTAYPLRNCQNLPDGSGGYSYKQSSNGEVVIVAYCPNGEAWLFWVNSKGTVFMPLIDSPIHAPEDSVDIAWSPDDKFIAFNIASVDKTDMYILNVSKSLKDPSIQPVQVNDGGGPLSYGLTWRPIVFSK